MFFKGLADYRFQEGFNKKTALRFLKLPAASPPRRTFGGEFAR
jgi:hypothetical protein